MKTHQKSLEPPKTGKRRIEAWVLDLYDACLKNARELIEESNLLLINGHHARGYFLAYTAMDELGKSQVVADYFNDMVSKAEFEAAFRDHRVKAAYVTRYVNIPDNLQGEWFIEYDPRSTGAQFQERNRSLYTEHVAQVPQLPAMAISLEAANELHATAAKYLSEIVRMAYISERIGTKAFTK